MLQNASYKEIEDFSFWADGVALSSLSIVSVITIYWPYQFFQGKLIFKV